MFVCALELMKTFPDSVSPASTWLNQLTGFLSEALAAKQGHGKSPHGPRPSVLAPAELPSADLHLLPCFIAS